MSNPREERSRSPGPFRPDGLATGIGSLPHLDSRQAVELVLGVLPEAPYWPQLPRRTPLEGMVLQYAEGFPGLRPSEGTPFVDTGPDGLEELEAFYERALGGDLGAFALSPERAEGFYTFERAIVQARPPRFAKGHVTGPVTFASSLRDAAGREILYDDTFREAVGHFLAAKARWQVRRLAALGAPVIVFLDEPVMEVYGSAYSGLSAEMALALWAPTLDALRAEGALSGIHCCGNTDWALLFRSGVDIVSFDSSNYLERMVLYAADLGRYLEAGGSLAWGAVPTGPEAEGVDADAVLEEVSAGIRRLEGAGIPAALVRSQALVTPSCGMGSLSTALAGRILELTAEVSRRLRSGDA